jgi:hypothetical protein
MGELGSFGLEVSQAGINRILEVLAIERRVEIKPVGIDARFLGSIALGGAVTISDFRVGISDTTATGSAQATPALSLSLDLPGRGPREMPLDVTFRIPEVIAVGLQHVGSKAFIVLSDLDLTMEPRCPPLVPQRAWDLVLGQLGRVKTRIVGAIEDQLRRRPIELFDLADHSRLSLPGDKHLPTRLEFETLEFKAGSLVCRIRVSEA